MEVISRDGGVPCAGCVVICCVEYEGIHSDGLGGCGRLFFCVFHDRR